MSGSVVNVLTPNGRRQNVRVLPNTAILKVLEDVCEKHKFDPNAYDLKHHKRILDLTTSFRFSGLPNNAQLEMVEALKKRQDAEVELVVQLGDGSRIEGKYTPNTTLLDIIKQLCANELSGDDLLAIYMRTEVSSDQLKNTSLKDLGLISGRAIIRLVHRDPNAAKIQASVALNLAKPSESMEDDEENRLNKIRKTDESSKSTTSMSIIQVLKEEKHKEEASKYDSNGDSEFRQDKPSAQSSQSDEPQLKEEEGEEEKEEEKMVINSPEPPVVEEELNEDPGEIHILGERNAVLFIQDAARAANLNDLPDSFFDLNVNDIKLLIKGLRTQSEGTIEQPLLTAKLREMEEEQKQLVLLNKYKAVIIRIQFPNRYVLQGTFTPYETIKTVMDFVRSYLGNPNIDFYLYTTPPKSVLSRESRLFEANCVPSAILHFGSDEKLPNYLKDDILDKISSPKASLIQALADRGIKQSNPTLSNESGPSMSQQARKSNAVNFSASSKTSSSSSSTTGDAKLPKWFKPFGK